MMRASRLAAALALEARTARPVSPRLKRTSLWSDMRGAAAAKAMGSCSIVLPCTFSSTYSCTGFPLPGVWVMTLHSTNCRMLISWASFSSCAAVMPEA